MAEPSSRSHPTVRRNEAETDHLSSAGLASTPAAVQTDDDSLILWMLSLTPTRRLEMAQGFADSVGMLRNGRRVS